MKPQRFEKKFPDKLSRYRSDVEAFSKDAGGIKAKRKRHAKATLSRKDKRKLERKLKHAKNLAFTKKEKVRGKSLGKSRFRAILGSSCVYLSK